MVAGEFASVPVQLWRGCAKTSLLQMRHVHAVDSGVCSEHLVQWILRQTHEGRSSPRSVPWSSSTTSSPRM